MNEIINSKARRYTIIILLLLLLGLAFLLFLPGNTTQFEIEDACGRFVNVLSHTVEDESVCASRCRAQCNAVDHDFKKVSFTPSEVGCHTCICYCTT